MMLGRSMYQPSGKFLLRADVVRRGSRPSCTMVRAPADAFLDLTVGQRQHLLFRLQRVFVRQVVGREQDGQRIVDEMQLLQRQDRLAFDIQVEALRIGNAVHGFAGLGDDFADR